MSRDENSGENSGTENKGRDILNSSPYCHRLSDYSALGKHFPGIDSCYREEVAKIL